MRDELRTLRTVDTRNRLKSDCYAIYRAIQVNSISKTLANSWLRNDGTFNSQSISTQNKAKHSNNLTAALASDRACISLVLASSVRDQSNRTWSDRLESASQPRQNKIGAIRSDTPADGSQEGETQSACPRVFLG